MAPETESGLSEVKRGYEAWHSEIRPAAVSLDLDTPWYQWIRATLPDIRDKNVLEVACGRGPLVDWMTRRGAHVVGCDISETALQIACRNFAGNYIAGDVHNLPLPSDAFDVVVSCETLEHTLAPAAAARELMRVTRPGGTLLLTTPNYLNTYGMYRAYLKCRGRRFGLHGIQPIDRLQFSFGIVGLLQKAGWKIESTAGMVHYFRPARDRLLWIDRSPLLRKLLKHMALHFAVVASARKE